MTGFYMKSNTGLKWVNLDFFVNFEHTVLQKQSSVDVL